MPFPFDKYPWLNFQELNLAYFIKHFREIFEQWDTLLHEMYDWKDATDAELAEWKSTVEDGISSWETGLLQSMEDWKDETEADISAWEAATLAALDAWKTATTAVFEQIRTEAAASATAAAGSATSAQTALTGAQAAQAAAEAAAAGIQSELAQIQTNTADISDLKTQIKNNIFPDYMLGLSDEFNYNASTAIYKVYNFDTPIPAGTTLKVKLETSNVSTIGIRFNNLPSIIKTFSDGKVEFEYTATEIINTVFLNSVASYVTDSGTMHVLIKTSCRTLDELNAEFDNSVSEINTDISELNGDVDAIDALANDIDYYAEYNIYTMRGKTDKKPNWEINNNTITCNSVYNSTDGASLLLCELKLADYIVNVNLQQANQSGSAEWAGLIFDFENANKYKVFYISYANSHACAYNMINRAFGDVIFDTSIADSVDFNNEITLTIKKAGNYEFFVNNTLIRTINPGENKTYNKIGVASAMVTKNPMSFYNFSIEYKDFTKIKAPIKTVYGYGDSIMYGSLANPISTKSWFNLLKEKITSEYPNTTWTNYGVPGHSTTSVLNLQVNAHASDAPQIAFIMCGTNDVRTDIDIDIATTTGNIIKMINICKSYDTIPIVFTLTPTLRDGSEGTTYDSTAKYKLKQINSAIRAICDSEKILCVDDAIAFGKISDLTTVIDATDKLHPNNAGHELIYNTAYNRIFK